MICSICGRDGATEPYNDGGRVHDWCRDAISFSRADILEFFNNRGFIVSRDALEKMLSYLHLYPRLVRSSKWLSEALNNAIKESMKNRGDGTILPEDIFISVELSFSTL